MNLEKIFEEVLNIPISDIISTRIEVFKGKDALCPFHNDQHIGSFKIDTRKNIFKCFSCGEGGNGINFIQKYDGISYKDAAIKIAQEFGIINGLISNSDIKYKPKYNVKQKDTKLCELANDRLLNTVYFALSRNQELSGKQNMLSEEHYEYLTNRGFNDLIIKKMNCFTMPDEKEAEIVIKALNRMGVKDFSGIPGFFYNNKTNKWDIQRMKGIGIPVRNANDSIVGIQVRRDETNGGPRYLWLTSSFVEDKKTLDKGTSATSAIAVISPMNLEDDKHIIITEGIFKANTVAEFFRCLSISVQGIGNISDIENTINEVINKYGLDKPEILIAYDADIDSNINVFKHMCSLKTLIDSIGLDVNVLLWNSDDGKGIDDIIHNRKFNSFKRKKFDEFKKYYEDVMEISKDLNGQVVKGILKEKYHERFFGEKG